MSALIGQIRPHARDINWVDPINLHWTHCFLGDVDDNRLPDVCQQVVAAAEKFDSFALQAVGVGAFPKLERPRTIWIGAGQGSDEIVAIQDSVELALADIGFKGEARRYVPHLTFGRTPMHGGSQEVSSILAELGDVDCGSTFVDELVVFGSELGRDGPTYHVIGRAPLGQ